MAARHGGVEIDGEFDPDGDESEGSRVEGEVLAGEPELPVTEAAEEVGGHG